MAAQAEQTGSEPEAQPSAESTPGQIAVGLLFFAGVIAASIWVISTLAPDEVREKRSPGYIDNIFASPIVIAAARIVLLTAAVTLLFAGLYIVASILVRMTRGHWLRRAGPFESELAGELAAGLDQGDAALTWWAEALDQNEQLEELLRERDEAIAELLQERESLLADIERRRGR